MKLSGKGAFEVDDQEVAGGGERMMIKKVVLNLNPEETLRLTRILLNEDREEAILFLKQCLKPQLDQKARGSMVRSFETT